MDASSRLALGGECRDGGFSRVPHRAERGRKIQRHKAVNLMHLSEPIGEESPLSRSNVFRKTKWFEVLKTTRRSQVAVMKLGPGQSTGEQAETQIYQQKRSAGGNFQRVFATRVPTRHERLGTPSPVSTRVPVTSSQAAIAADTKIFTAKTRCLRRIQECARYAELNGSSKGVVSTTNK